MQRTTGGKEALSARLLIYSFAPAAAPDGAKKMATLTDDVVGLHNVDSEFSPTFSKSHTLAAQTCIKARLCPTVRSPE
ncbi:hypothetical protein [Neolewinella persica]|uniref:hypothetical protein n=1 Tax=Neolewinella persica TaxID=70998 RepID=UPI00039E44D9|nr:hypothetical protein [Neolewinella persica]